MTAGPPEWTEHAACLDEDTSLFFPRSEVSPRIATAKAICQSCTVQPECLDFAYKTESTGIWGGLTDEERKEMRRFYV